MLQGLVHCLLVNAAGILVSGSILLFYPKGSGFTITAWSVTHYIEGGVFLSAVLMCLLDLAVGIYLALLLLHPR